MAEPDTQTKTDPDPNVPAYLSTIMGGAPSPLDQVKPDEPRKPPDTSTVTPKPAPTEDGGKPIDIDRELAKNRQDNDLVAQVMREGIDKQRQMSNDFGRMAARPKPLPKLQDMPQTPELKMRSEFQAFQNPLTWIAIAGSLLARRPAVAAMNAAAGVMEGYRKGDDERIKLEQQKWKDNLEATLKQNEKEIQMNDAIWNNEKLTMVEKQAQGSAMAAATQNATLLKAYNDGDFKKVYDLWEVRRKAGEHAQDQENMLERANIIADARTKRSISETEMEDINAISDGIESGKTPPNLQGFYKLKGPVEAELQRRGFDLAKANLEYRSAERQVATLNGSQMTRFVGLAQSVQNTIDEAKELSRQMELGGVPALNKVELEAYIQTRGNTPEGQLATRYVTAINTLREEFANLAQGGYAPTESVWKLANRQINENYGVKQLGASLDEVKRLIGYRVKAIPGLSTMGPAGANRYTGSPAGGAPGGGGGGADLRSKYGLD